MTEFAYRTQRSSCQTRRTEDMLVFEHDSVFKNVQTLRRPTSLRVVSIPALSVSERFKPFSDSKDWCVILNYFDIIANNIKEYISRNTVYPDTYCNNIKLDDDGVCLCVYESERECLCGSRFYILSRTLQLTFLLYTTVHTDKTFPKVCV